jgi:hypothetical protein
MFGDPTIYNPKAQILKVLITGSLPWNTTQSLVGEVLSTAPATHAATCALQCFRQVTRELLTQITTLLCQPNGHISLRQILLNFDLGHFPFFSYSFFSLCILGESQSALKYKKGFPFYAWGIAIFADF